MNTAVEVVEDFGLEYYYVSVHFTGNALVIGKSENTWGKYIEKQMKLSDIGDVRVAVIDGIERLTFWYEGNQYIFKNHGNQVLSHLKKKLKRQLTV